MATLQELQERLDKKTFDPSQLDDAQRAAVDLAFESGELKGYNSVAEVEKERSLASQIIAGEKEKKDQPFTVATRGLLPFTKEGIERADLELIGDVGSGAYVYIKDAPKVTEAFRRDPKMGYGIDKIRATQIGLDKFQKLLGGLPFVKGTKLLSGTARVVGRFLDDLRLISKAPTQLLATEAKSQFASMGGSALGSLSYDAANLATDFDVALNNDLSKVSDNDIKKLPYAEQVLVHSLEAARTAGIFNLVGSSIAPVLGTTLRGMKGVFGLGSPETKALAEAAEKRGIKLSISTLADTGTIGGKIISGFEKVFGVIPLVNTFAKRQRKAVEEQTFRAMLDQVLNKAPLEEQALLNFKFLPTMQQNFEKYFDSIRQNYSVVDAIAEKMGNPKFIPTATLRAEADKFVKAMEGTRAEPFLGRTTTGRIPEYDAAKVKGSLFADPMFDVANKARNLDEYITPTEYQGLMQDIMNAASKSEMDDYRNLFFGMKNAGIQDFNKIANPDNIQGYLASANFKAEFDNILNSSGEQAAAKYAQNVQKDMKAFGEELESANAYFSRITQAFNSPVAKEIRNTSANVFAVKGLMGILPMGRIQPDQMFDKTISNIFRGDSAMAIEQLKVILGVGNKQHPLGEQVFNRARNAFMAEAMIKSFEKQPALAGKTIGDIMDKARELNIIDYKGTKEIFERTGTSGLEELKRLNPELATKYELGQVDVLDLKAQASQAGQFNIKTFKEQLGLIRPRMTEAAAKKLARGRFEVMYGGGQKGREAANNLIELVDIMDKEFGKYISDSNQYLMRRIMLSGAGQTAIGGGFIAGAAASGGILNALPLTIMLASTGAVLASPKALKFMLDVYTDYERLAKLNKRIDPLNPPRSVFKLLNWMGEEDKDFPNVDPRKINFEEVTDYLLTKNLLVPQLGFTPQAINPKLRSQFFPELDVINKSSEAEIAGGMNYLKGSAQGTQNAENVVNYQPENNYQQAPRYEQFVDPRYLQQSTPLPQAAPQQKVVTPQNYNMLFPNDSLGQAILQNEQQQ